MPSAQANSRAWSDPNSTNIQALIEASRVKGWREALQELEAAQPFFVKRMKDFALANWHRLLFPRQHLRTLDIGCGFGSLSLGMTEAFAMPVGVEVLPERVTYAALRAAQEQCSSRFARASGLSLPFAPASFDLVTMNGVLEWAGLYGEGNPQTLQHRMLAEARRVAGSDGQVAIAIENRFALESLLGLADTHTGLTWITALPRGLADILSRIRRGHGYRTYLYSRRGYYRLLQSAGFETVRVMDLISSYNDYDFVVNPDDALTYRFLFRNRLVRPFYGIAGRARRMLSRLYPPILGSIGYAYLVVAGKHVTTALDADSPIWARIGALPAGSRTARFACKGEEPGQIAVVTHDGERLVALVEIGSRLPESEQPSLLPMALRSAGAAQQVRFVSADEVNGVPMRVYLAR